VTLGAGRTFEIRRFSMEDEPRVLDLLRSTLGEGPAGARSSAFFRWKHLDNPFGESFLLLADDGERILGIRALMRWRFRSKGRILHAVRAVDTATLPAAQGRGVFARLTGEAIRMIRSDVDLVFNTPNEKSLPGYLKMGWSVVGHAPVWLRVKRPVRFIARVGSRSEAARPGDVGPSVDARPASKVLDDADAVDALLAQADIDDERLFTDRSAEFLHWRYASEPFDYRAVTEDVRGDLRAFAIFRIRPRGRLWEAAITEMVAPRRQLCEVRRLLHKISRAAKVDHLTCSFSPTVVSPAMLAASGFMRAPTGPTLVTNPLVEAIRPDPRELRSWALTLGDLEVF
jgi:GNAT superfamily N-acetyltransferase